LIQSLIAQFGKIAHRQGITRQAEYRKRSALQRGGDADGLHPRRYRLLRWNVKIEAKINKK
jgi:hypothetical protein